MAKDLGKILIKNPLLPVVEIEDANNAKPLRDAIQEGGINIIEITLRTKDALTAAEQICQDLDFTVGLGTLIEADQFRYASQLGIDFVSSPGLNRDLMSVAEEEKIAYLPGVFTPSEIMEARDFEYSTMKFFPAYSEAGMQHFPQVSAAFRSLHFCLTGGVNDDNFIKTLSMETVVSVGGSWLAPRELIKNKGWASITHRVKEAVTKLTEFQQAQQALQTEQPVTSETVVKFR